MYANPFSPVRLRYNTWVKLGVCGMILILSRPHPRSHVQRIPLEVTMAATADIVLADYSAANKTFTPSVAVSNGNQYADVSSTVASPRSLTVKHVLLPASAQTGVEVHSLAFAHTAVDSVSGKMYTVSVTLTFRVPRTGPTLGNRRDLWTFVKNFLTDTNIEKLLIGGF